jgi:hypothetical protein
MQFEHWLWLERLQDKVKDIRSSVKEKAKEENNDWMSNNSTFGSFRNL